VKVVDDLLSDEIKKGRQSHHQEEEVAEVEVEQKALVMTEERGVSRRRRRRRRKMRMRRGCDENSFETQEWNHKRQVWKRISYSRTIAQQSQRRI
jgi:hypothetical protein